MPSPFKGNKTETTVNFTDDLAKLTDRGPTFFSEVGQNLKFHHTVHKYFYYKY